ncbi:hypothetical protein QV08_04310 [Gallibacterium salpingitidis]|uniref:hypothetical protein n=1 Tax=Gallibacterium salpingitidis TaxID=505341 RepID=UPI000804C69F|nr:hypothetical protein [Gallibacterium salpingitidis]OBX08435.1 hypothetical protein QV08_04310 [Gallibacterium salpingitidis]
MPAQSKDTIQPKDTISFLIVGNVLSALAGLALVAILVYYIVYGFIDPHIARPWSRDLLYVVGGGLVCTVIVRLIGSSIKKANYYPIAGSGQASHTGDILASTSTIFISGVVIAFIIMFVGEPWFMYGLIVLFAIITFLYYLVVVITFLEIKRIK